MKTHYDKKIDAFYIKFHDTKNKVLHTVKLKDFLLIDIGKKGQVHGIEILNASKHLPGKNQSHSKKQKKM